MPLAIEELLALMLIDCSVAVLTVSGKLLEVIPFWVAVTLLEPTAIPVAKPLVAMLTAAVLDEAHVAVLLRFCVLPSLKVPVAVN